MTGTDRVDVPALAAILHCSEWKARRLMGSEIPAIKGGRAWTASRRDVDAYIERRTVVGRRVARRKGRAKAAP